jgi:hypothetical protein
MEARFARLEALITSMVAQVKSTTYGLGKAKDREDDQSYGLNADQGFFCGIGFSRLVAPNEMMLHMSKGHESWAIDDGNHVMVPNLNEMISTIAPMIKASTRVPKPRGVDERLDTQCGETQHQVQLPQSFVLTNIIPNSIGVSTLGRVSRKAPSSIPRSKAPISSMGWPKQCVRHHYFLLKH